MVSKEDAVTTYLKAVADATRRSIVELLRAKELSVLEIAAEFPMSRPAISKHLRILRDAGLVIERPEGRQRLYALERAPLRVVESWLREVADGRLGGGAGAPLAVREQGLRGRRRTPGRKSGRDDWRVW